VKLLVDEAAFYGLAREGIHLDPGAFAQQERLPDAPSPPTVVVETKAKLKVAGLFAGVGGVEEGFRQAGHESTMLCELDTAARHVLGRHFRGTEITEDVRALTALPVATS